MTDEYDLPTHSQAMADKYGLSMSGCVTEANTASQYGAELWRASLASQCLAEFWQTDVLTQCAAELWWLNMAIP